LKVFFANLNTDTQLRLLSPDEIEMGLMSTQKNSKKNDNENTADAKTLLRRSQHNVFLSESMSNANQANSTKNTITVTGASEGKNVTAVHTFLSSPSQSNFTLTYHVSTAECLTSAPMAQI
jgi:hypothetical protein